MHCEFGIFPELDVVCCSYANVQ